ncbi:MAG TPA: choice-of-anchor M domain-containing protein [Aeriscardovia aeriphila]|uniref:Choice-of-anchor M domain-containing protein n=1 Tax=Aeriscardovia aeriphila TaxID=218139 RepID=A0A921KAH9_9BIFI|nr:choice-of-anchor M domain-containing protein [Aeriscardovia aeriphila]
MRMRHTTAYTIAKVGCALAIALASLITGTSSFAQPRDSEDPQLQQQVAADEKIEIGSAEIAAGHIDIGPRSREGSWSILARDDSGSEPVWRDPAELVIRVKDEALLEAPTGEDFSFMAAQPGEKYYVIPQTQNPEIVWLGWNTQDPQITRELARGATMRIGPIQGPGDVWLFLQDGAFGAPLRLADSRAEKPQDIWVDVNTHVHANWVFSAPGAYVARVSFLGEVSDGSQREAHTLLRFAVGNDVTADQVRTMALEEESTASTRSSEATPSAQGSDAGGDENKEEAGVAASTIAIGALVGVAGLVALAVILYRNRIVRKEIAQARTELE